MTDYIRLLRPQQWSKNGFVLAGYFFVQGWEQPGLTAQVALALVGFVLVSSAVYVLNDLADREVDRHHPSKCRRPIASGRVSTTAARLVLILLLAIGLLVSWQSSQTVLALTAGYFVLNLLYSHRLQYIVILDVFSIAAGFMLRVLTGTVGVGIPPSNWLLLCSIMLSLFLGFGKRYAELISLDGANPHRQVLDSYSEPLLQTLIGVSAGAALLTYALYTVDASTLRTHETGGLIYTVPLVAYGLFRYLYNLYGKRSGQDPSQEIPTDPHLLGVTAVWLLTVLYLLR